MNTPHTTRPAGRHNKAMRLLPVVMVAGVGLSALKATDVIWSSVEIGGAISPASAQSAKPDAAAAAAKGDDAAAEKGNPCAAAKGEAAKAKNAGNPCAAAKGRPGARPKDVMDDEKRFLSKSERAILESLAERRRALDARERDLQLQQNLLKAAEQRIAGKIAELKALEQKIEKSFLREETRKIKQLKGLVTLYENMKPREAARIFDRLEMDVLVGLAEQIKPRKMAVIMASMTPDAAERLTLELAARASRGGAARPGKLPSLPEKG